MATFEMIYLRDVEDDQAAAAFEALFPDMPAALARLEGNPWLQLRGIHWEDLEEVAAALSMRLGCPAVAFAAQTTVDALDLHLLDAGQCVRHLAFDPESGWSAVSGEPQPWEAPLLDDQVPEDPAPDYPTRLAVERRALIQGSTWPYVGSAKALALGEAMGLPGFLQRDGWSAERPLGPRPSAPRPVLVLGVIAAFLLMLVADLYLLPPSSLWSTLVLFAQIGVFVWVLTKVAPR